jgi:hypothetical protein
LEKFCLQDFDRRRLEAHKVKVSLESGTAASIDNIHAGADRACEQMFFILGD